MLKLWLLFGCLNLELFLRVSCNVVPRNTVKVFPNCYRQQDEECPNANISFWLYDYQNPNGLLLNVTDIVDFSESAPWNSLKVLIHGFGGDRFSSPNKELLLKLPHLRDESVISMEYKNLVLYPCYTEAVHNAPFVGRCLVEFLASALDMETLQPEKLHLIGFGMGAHVAAFAAKLLAQHEYKVGHITGLDPAKPLFLTSNLTQRLDSNDAIFVDVIHSDVFLHGILQPLGHVDFFPNMGVSQPDCGPIDLLSTHDCYHHRAAEYYAESIGAKTEFWGFRCTDLYGFTIGECQPTNDIQLMGYNTPSTARGNYFLATNTKAPYAKGTDFDNMDRSLFGKTYLGDSLIDKLYRMGAEFRNITVNIG